MFQADLLAYQESWQGQSACRSLGTPREVSEIFFTEDEEVEAKAKEFCHTHCPVQTECLQFAFRYSIDHGIFGGLADRERRSLLKKVKRSGLDEMFAHLEPKKEIV